MALFVDLVAPSNGLHGSVQMDSIALFSWIGWLRHHGIFNWPIDNYYYTGERETNFLGQRVIKQHHTLTQILNPLIKCGFQIEAIEEAMPPADMMGMPGMCNEMRRPMMLLVKVKKV